MKGGVRRGPGTLRGGVRRHETWENRRNEVSSSLLRGDPLRSHTGRRGVISVHESRDKTSTETHRLPFPSGGRVGTRVVEGRGTDYGLPSDPSRTTYYFPGIHTYTSRLVTDLNSLRSPQTGPGPTQTHRRRKGRRKPSTSPTDVTWWS